MYNNTPEAAPVRRRIIQQPFRTEAPFALIASDATPMRELAARLNRTRPVITFPSLSHFLAEPPQRERWAAILVARSGAWDPRLDTYVQSRRYIALFGLPEESYGWPEAVARVRNMDELEPWLEALHAPGPAAKKERVKRSSRAQAGATVAPQNVAPSQSAAAAPAAGETQPQTPDVAPGDAAPATARQPSSQQTELDPPHAERKTRKATANAEHKTRNTTANAEHKTRNTTANAEHKTRNTTANAEHKTRNTTANAEQKTRNTTANAEHKTRRSTPHAEHKTRRSTPHAEHKTRRSTPHAERAVERPSPQPAARPISLVRSVLAEERARRATADDGGDSELVRLAAELGLVRAFELLDELRERAKRLVSAASRRR